MAVWLGLCRNCAACWKYQHEVRIDSANTAHLVCHAFAMVAAVEGKKMTPHNDETPSGQGKGFQNTNQTKQHNSNRPAHFAGTDNPRHLRVIQALMTRPLPREQLDTLAGASNGPELVAELRRRGLELPCTRTKKKDRDLFDCWPGVYHFTQQDRRRVYRWLAKRRKNQRG